MTARLLRVPALVFSLALAARLPAAPAGQAPAPSGKALPHEAAVAAAAATNRAAKPPPGPLDLTDREPATDRRPGDFTIVVLPDTQNYTAARGGGLPEMFIAQTEWILANRVSRNIVYVAHEGDISNDGNEVVLQWRNATNALYRLEDPRRTGGQPDGIPYGVAVGNHDMRAGGTGRFNEYFGTNHFAPRGYYGGYYGTNNDSHVDLFRACGQSFVVVSLRMAAGDEPALMRWADKVLHDHADRQAIVVTHSLLNPAPWPIPGSWTPEGPPIVAALTNNPNLFLMLCGHRHGEGRRRVIVGNGPRYIDIVLSDYQSYANGGDGYLRLMEFSPLTRTIRVKTFSPWTGKWSAHPSGFFTLPWPQPRP